MLWGVYLSYLGRLSLRSIWGLSSYSLYIIYLWGFLSGAFHMISIYNIFCDDIFFSLVSL